METSPQDAASRVGRDDLEYSTEQDMKMVSLTHTPLLPGIIGTNYHGQLRDNFVLSSINPNYAYINCTIDGRSRVSCVNLQTGEHRTVGKLWGLYGGNAHCLATGFGYVAVVTSVSIIVAKENYWRSYWRREALSGMINSCVFTKLLAGENGTPPEEPVLIIGSNGGAVYTMSLPEELPDEFMEIEERDSVDPLFGQIGSDIDQTGVTPGYRRVLKHVPRPVIHTKQLLTRRGPEAEAQRLPNINCLVQGKGIYTDYLIGAPDYQARLLIFLRDYDGKTVEPDKRSDREEDKIDDCKESIFQLVEHQRNENSLVLPLIKDPINPVDPGDYHSYYNLPSSLNLAWAPWYHRSILAAGTDSNELILYDFDKAQALLSELEPSHIFTLQESSATVLFRYTSQSQVRLMKFCPIPSIPILAFADMTNRLSFLNCVTWSIEKIAIPGAVTGMTWTLDGSKLLVATDRGFVSVPIKPLPSLVDSLLIQLALNKTDGSNAFQLTDDDMQERLDQLTAGRRNDLTIDWLDEDYVNPPIRNKSGPGPMVPNVFMSNSISVRPFGGIPMNYDSSDSGGSDYDSVTGSSSEDDEEGAPNTASNLGMAMNKDPEEEEDEDGSDVALSSKKGKRVMYIPPENDC